jgi:Arc/MetJ-type ribon-helix-helix transcriptional regulator
VVRRLTDQELAGSSGIRLISLGTVGIGSATHAQIVYDDRRNSVGTYSDFAAMPYQFPPEIDELVRQQMAVGGYSSEDDLLQDALSALAERRQVHDDIRIGIQDMEAGRGRPLEDVDADLRKKHNIPRSA